MNPAQQHAPSSEELCLAALEQALANSLAREIETQRTLSLLTDSFQLLRELVQTHIPLCTSPKIPLVDTVRGHVMLDLQPTCPPLW